ncbi:MAG TPA: hypothetical protein VGM05_02340 [Planctomycetaceae bacterium]|jgi:hypothetical protein
MQLARKLTCAGIIMAIGLVCIGELRAEQPESVEANPPRLYRLAFSGDGSHLIAGGDAVRVFRTETGAMVQRVPLARMSSPLAAFPGRENLFAEAGEDGVVRIWSIFKPQPVRELQGHRGRVRNLAISPDGKRLASVAGQIVGGRWTRSEFRLWDAATGRSLRDLVFDSDEVDCAAFSRDGKLLALALDAREVGAASRIDIYEVTGWKRQRSVEFSPGFASAICFPGNTGDLLIVGGDCPSVDGGCQPTGRLWIALRNERTARQLEQDREYSYFHGVLTPAADRLVIGTSTVTATVNAKGKVDGARLGPLVQLRDAKTGDILWSTITTGAGDPEGIAISADGKLIAAVVEQTIHVFDAETGENVREIVVAE